MGGMLRMLSEESIKTIKWNEQDLVPAIVQDTHTKDVLMMAYMNIEALHKTIEIGETVFWSRSRQSYWHKGETSGNTQKVTDIYIDCDADTLLIMVEPRGAACHTGQTHCFYRTLEEFNKHPKRD